MLGQVATTLKDMGAIVRPIVAAEIAPVAESVKDMGGKVDNLDDKVNNIEGRLAALEIKSTEVPAAPRMPGGSASSFYQPVPPASAPRTSSAAPASRASAADADGRVKVFAAGFPRDLPYQAHRAHWEGVVKGIPTDVSRGAQLHAGNKASYAVSFPNAAAARSFMAFVRDNPDLTAWTSKRSDELVPFPIRFKMDCSMEERQLGKAFHVAWEILVDRVTMSPYWEKGVHRLNGDRKGGHISVVEKYDMWKLFEVKRSSDGKMVDLIPNDHNLGYWGFLPDEIESVRRKVMEAASQQ